MSFYHRIRDLRENSDLTQEAKRKDFYYLDTKRREVTLLRRVVFRIL